MSTLAGHPLETPAAFAWQKETPGHGKERTLLEMPGIVLCGEVQVLPMRSQLSLYLFPGDSSSLLMGCVSCPTLNPWILGMEALDEEC